MPCLCDNPCQHFGNEVSDIDMMTLDPKILASFLRKAYSLRDEISESKLDEQPIEQYHIAQKNKLKITIRKGPRPNIICNVEKDGMKLKLCNISST